MAPEIKVWQIQNQNLEAIDSTLSSENRKEKQHLEEWITNEPSILGDEILLIGRQVKTKFGKFLDLLGMDKDGNTIIIELKRGKTDQNTLAQAIGYASEIAEWDFNKLNEECTEFQKKDLTHCLNENFEGFNTDPDEINQNQRILLVGTSIGEYLQEVINWLSEKYQMRINALILRYIKTKSGDELLARTMMIPEELEKKRSQKHRRPKVMSDEKGVYSDEGLTEHLERYFSEDRVTTMRMKEVMFPLCLTNQEVTRDMIIQELVSKKKAIDTTKAGRYLAVISHDIGIKKRDYLRQVISYDYLEPGKKDNYRIEPKYKDLVRKLSHFQT